MKLHLLSVTRCMNLKDGSSNTVSNKTKYLQRLTNGELMALTCKKVAKVKRIKPRK